MAATTTVAPSSSHHQNENPKHRSSINRVNTATSQTTSEDIIHTTIHHADSISSKDLITMEKKKTSIIPPSSVSSSTSASIPDVLSGIAATGDDHQQQHQQQPHSKQSGIVTRNRRSTSASAHSLNPSMATPPSSPALSGCDANEILEDDQSIGSTVERYSASGSIGGGSSVAHLVIYEGYLSGWIRKFSPHYGTGWQKRYFCLLEKDASLAYWRTIPEYADEQPTGSINLVNVRSVELDGGLGLVLCTSSRDYRLLFETPSQKDLWFNRILVLHHRARKRIDGKASDALANKFASWATAQQQKSGTGLSTVFRSLRNRHNQINEWTDGMGPTTDQVDVKRQLLQHLLLYKPLQLAFNAHPYMSHDHEVPLEYHIPNIMLHDAEISNVYSSAFSMNVYYLHNHHRLLDETTAEDGDSDDDEVVHISRSASEARTARRQQSLEEAELVKDDGLGEARYLRSDGSGRERPSPSSVDAHDAECPSQRPPHIVVVDDDLHVVPSQEFVARFGVSTTPPSPHSPSSSPSSSPSIAPFKLESEASFMSSIDSGGNLHRHSYATDVTSVDSSSNTLIPKLCVCCTPTLTRPLQRSASLDSFHSDALRHVRFPSQKRIEKDRRDLRQAEGSRQSTLRHLLGLSRNQAKTWKLGLREERSRSIDLSDLSQNSTTLLLLQSSAPLIPNPIGFIKPVRAQHIEFKEIKADNDNSTAVIPLRPIFPGDTRIPVLSETEVPAISVGWSTASEILQRSIMGAVGDLATAEQLCHDLDGISRLTDELAAGKADSRERQRIASCLYERSSPSPISPFVECLLAPAESSASDSIEFEDATTPQSIRSEKSSHRKSASQTAAICARCRLPSSSSLKQRYSTPPPPQCLLKQLASSRRATMLKTLSTPATTSYSQEKFLDNVILGHLFVAIGSGRYTPYLAVLISFSAIGSGKCFDIRRRNIEEEDLKLPSAHSLNTLHLYPMDIVQWPLPPTLPPRTTPPTPTYSIHLPKCHKITSVNESETGFDWSCQETYWVARRFHEGMKKETRLISFRARTEREANVFRQSMVSSKLSSLTETERSRIIRANYKGRRWRAQLPQ